MVAAERAPAPKTATNAADPYHTGEGVAAARGERVRGLSTLSAAFGALVGTAVLLAWALGLEAHTALGSQTTMTADTGLGFLAIAISLFALRRLGTGRVRLGIRASAVVVAGLALSTLAQDLLARDLGIDRAIFAEPEPPAGSAHPSRMAPSTAVCFALLAAAVLGLDARARGCRAAAVGLAIATTVIAYLALLGDLGNAGAGAALPGLTQMAAPTAATFVVLALGVLFARPDRRPLNTLLGDGSGSRLAREAIPAILAFPALFEVVEAATRMLGFGPRFADSILHLSVLVLFLPLILRSAVALNRSETLRALADRARAENEVSYRSLIESAGETVVAADSAGRIVYVNPAGEHAFGYPPGELVGQRLTALMPERFRERHERGLARFLWTRRSERDRPDGRSSSGSGETGPSSRSSWP